MAKDYYAVLGLVRGADDVVVHAAWKALLRKYHPDTHAGAAAEARARDINEAFAVLGKPASRAAYDRARSAPPPPPRPGPHYRPSAAPYAQPRGRPVFRAPLPPRRGRAVLLALATIPAALLLFYRYPDAFADLGDRLQSYGQYRPSTEASFSPISLSGPARAFGAMPPPVDAALVARAVRRADHVFHIGGIGAAARVSRACDAAAIDWPALDTCAAFDIAVSLADVTNQGSLNPPDPYFILTAQRDALRVEQFDSDSERAAGRLQAIRAQVVPVMMDLLVRRAPRSAAQASAGSPIDRRPVAALSLR